jgi:hypothetical protein
MIRMVLALGLIAAAAPGLAMAQPYDNDQGRYDNDQGRYCDDQGRCSDRAADAHDYSRDSNYDDRGRGDRQDGYYDDRGQGAGRYEQYTGRVGARWVDGYGRECAWREVTFRDTDGAPAYKWITRCQ